MGKTYRKIDTTIEDIQFSGRSVSYKSEHSRYSRGGRSERDKAAHAGHRNQNKCIDDETQYVNFSQSTKKSRNVCKYKKMNPEKYNGLSKIETEHKWQKNTSLKENLIRYIEESPHEKLYIKRCLKQIERRGSICKKHKPFDSKFCSIE